MNKEINNEQINCPGGLIKIHTTSSGFDVGEAAQHASGAKLDGSKIDASLLQLFANSLLEVARVGTYGVSKYTRGGFLEVPDGERRYQAAMMRHFFAEEVEGTFDQDPYLDRPECAEFKGRIRHKAQVAWNALAALELELREEVANGHK